MRSCAAADASHVYRRPRGRRPQPRAQDARPRDALERRGERSAVADRRAARWSPSARKSRNTSRSEATTGRPAASASSAARPKPSLTREGEHVGGAVQALELVGLERAEHPHVLGHAELPGARGEAVDLVAVVEQRRPAGDQEQRIALGQRLAQPAKPSSRQTDPLRGSMPPTVRTARRSSRPSADAVGGALGGVARRPKRTRSTPLRHQSARRRRTPRAAARPTAPRRTTRSGARSSGPGTRRATVT